LPFSLTLSPLVFLPSTSPCALALLAPSLCIPWNLLLLSSLTFSHSLSPLPSRSCTHILAFTSLCSFACSFLFAILANMLSILCPFFSLLSLRTTGTCSPFFVLSSLHFLLHPLRSLHAFSFSISLTPFGLLAPSLPINIPSFLLYQS
jgi:hypothetical protein